MDMPGNPSGLFGKQVHKFRAARNWPLDELSARTGIAAGHLSRIENGKRPPTERVAQAMDSAFEVTDFTELYEEMRDWAPPASATGKNTRTRQRACLTGGRPCCRACSRPAIMPVPCCSPILP